MKTKGYLIISKTGCLRAVKTLRTNVNFDEVVIALDVEIPDKAFKPIIEAHIKIDKNDITPLLIEAGELNALSEKLTHDIGFNVKLTSIEADYPEGKNDV